MEDDTNMFRDVGVATTDSCEVFKEPRTLTKPRHLARPIRIVAMCLPVLQNNQLDISTNERSK